jgi:hypothetical protein
MVSFWLEQFILGACKQYLYNFDAAAANKGSAQYTWESFGDAYLVMHTADSHSRVIEPRFMSS